MNKRDEKRKKMAEEKYQWKVTVGFEEVDVIEGLYVDGGVLEESLFDSIDEAMEYVVGCVKQNGEEPVDQTSKNYIFEHWPSFVKSETRITTKKWWKEPDTIDYITYIVEVVDRKK